MPREEPLYAQDPGQYYVPCGYEDLTVDGTVRTPTPPQGARIGKAYFRGGNVRWTIHGTNPSASVGVPAYDGYEEWFSINDLNALKLIREGSTNGEVFFNYWR